MHALSSCEATFSLLFTFSKASECAWLVSCFRKLSDAFLQLQNPDETKETSAFLLSTNRLRRTAVTQGKQTISAC
jgi:hypothetical protein